MITQFIKLDENLDIKSIFKQVEKTFNLKRDDDMDWINYSSKMMFLFQLLQNLKSERHRVLIFS